MTRLWVVFERAAPEVALFLVGALLVGAVLAAVCIRVLPELARLLLVGAVIAAVTLTLYTTMHPTGTAGIRLRPVLNPLPTLSDAWHGGAISFATEQALANVLLLMPFGCALALLLGWRIAIVSSFVLSMSVEAAQWVLPTGRLAETSDVLLNVTGGAIGAGIAVLALSIVRTRPPAQVRRAASRPG